MHRKNNVYNDTEGKEVTISTNPSVSNSKANRPEMEMTNAAYNHNDTADLQPQEEMATIHANPSTSEDLVKDGMVNPTYSVQLVISEVKENPYSCDPSTEEIHSHCTVDDVQ